MYRRTKILFVSSATLLRLSMLSVLSVRVSVTMTFVARSVVVEHKTAVTIRTVRHITVGIVRNEKKKEYNFSTAQFLKREIDDDETEDVGEDEDRVVIIIFRFINNNNNNKY
eukprot:PhM_4_TR18868/c5_g1_i1/m.104948